MVQCGIFVHVFPVYRTYHRLYDSSRIIAKLFHVQSQRPTKMCQRSHQYRHLQRQVRARYLENTEYYHGCKIK